MTVVDIQRETTTETPDDDAIRHVVESALRAVAHSDSASEVSLRIVDREEMRELNGRYRQRDYATNVLSFPADIPEDLELPFLGDIAICAPVVREEAGSQGKNLYAHWDHMLVHGVLHLLGYDHETDTEATAMESLEIRVLAGLGRSDPYAVESIDTEACS